MGHKLLWSGLTLIQAGGLVLNSIPAVQIVGAVIMVIGCVLNLIDK